nr:hypothetical protein Cry52Nrm2_p163 [Cryptomonas curvata]
MYILVKLINKISSLINFLFKKNTNNIRYELQLIWKHIFEKTLELLIANKMIYFLKLKKIEKFTKLFKRIEFKLLFSINHLFNYNIIHKAPLIKNIYVRFFYDSKFFLKNLIWLSIKKFYFLKKRSIFNTLFETKYTNIITCFFCSAKIFIYELVYFFDFFYYSFNQKLINNYDLKKKNGSIIVSNHFCIICKTKTKTYHELYFSKIPINWYISINLLSNLNRCIFFHMLLFIVSFNYTFHNEKKKNFIRKFNFKHIYLLILKNSHLNLLPFSLLKKKILVLYLNIYPIFNLNTHGCFLETQIVINKKILKLLHNIKKFNFKINIDFKNSNYYEKNYSVKSDLLDKFLDKLNKLKIYNKLNIKFLIGKPKNLDLILNFF